MTEPLLPELAELEQVIAAGGSHLERRVLCEVTSGTQRWPVIAVTLGNPDPAAGGVPPLGLIQIAGVTITEA